MNRLQQIGDATIAVADDEYASGYQVGYLQYKIDYCSRSLKRDNSTKTPSDMDIYDLIVGEITSVRHSGRYLAGYVTGWIAALLEGKTSSGSASTLPYTNTEEVKL